MFNLKMAMCIFCNRSNAPCTSICIQNEIMYDTFLEWCPYSVLEKLPPTRRIHIFRQYMTTIKTIVHTLMVYNLTAEMPQREIRYALQNYIARKNTEFVQIYNVFGIDSVIDFLVAVAAVPETGRTDSSLIANQLTPEQFAYATHIGQIDQVLRLARNMTQRRRILFL